MLIVCTVVMFAIESMDLMFYHTCSPQKDFRFGLLWEWSLYEAMLYSPYVAARLQTYTEKGRTALELLLAKLGIPLQQARSPYLRACVVH